MPVREPALPATALGVDIDGDPWLNPPSIGCDEFRPGTATGPLSATVNTVYTNVAAGFEAIFHSEVEGHATFKSVADVPGEIDLATIYVPARVGVAVMDDIAKKGITEVWLNPGADDPAVVKRAKELGLKTVQTCSILAIGESPSRY